MDDLLQYVFDEFAHLISYASKIGLMVRGATPCSSLFKRADGTGFICQVEIIDKEAFSKLYGSNSVKSENK